MDEKLGLCILVCVRHTKAELFSRFFHIPRNPLFTIGRQQTAEVFAPVHIKPNFVRAAKTGSYTTAGPVIETVGGYFGMSSFTLSGNTRQKCMHEFDQHIDHLLLAANQREEIRNTAISKWGIDDVLLLLRRWKQKNETKTSEILTCKEGSTFMEQQDAYHTWTVLQSDMTGAASSAQNTDNENRAPSCRIADLVINCVHVNDNYGMTPFRIAMPKDDKQLLLAQIINVVLNCRPIHRNTLSYSTTTPHWKLEHLDIRTLLKYAKCDNASPHPRKIGKTGLLHSVWSAANTNQQFPPIHHRVCNLLHQITPAVEQDDLQTNGSELISIHIRRPVSNAESNGRRLKSRPQSKNLRH